MAREETCGPLVEGTQEESFGLKRKFDNDCFINQRFHPREKTALEHRKWKLVWKRTIFAHIYIKWRVSQQNLEKPWQWAREFRVPIRMVKPECASLCPCWPFSVGSAKSWLTRLGRVPHRVRHRRHRWPRPAIILQNQGNSFQGRLGNTKGLRSFNVKMEVKNKEQGAFSDRPHARMSIRNWSIGLKRLNSSSGNHHLHRKLNVSPLLQGSQQVFFSL